MKKIAIIIIVISSIYFIYNIFRDKKVYYTSISDGMGYYLEYSFEDYIKDYLEEKDVLEEYRKIKIEDERIIDLIRNINDNVAYDKKTLQNILIKTDILTVSIGYNDLVANILNLEKDNIVTYIDSYLKDLDTLLKLLRKCDKEKIIFLGYNNPYGQLYDNLFDEINSNVKKICSQYDIIFIELENIDYNTLEGQRNLFNNIKYYIDTNIK